MMNSATNMEISFNQEQDQNSFEALDEAKDQSSSPLHVSQGTTINYNDQDASTPQQSSQQTYGIAQRFRNGSFYTILPINPPGLGFPLAKDHDGDFSSLICFDIPQDGKPRDTLLVKGIIDPTPPNDPSKRRRFTNAVPVDLAEDIPAYSLDGMNAFIPSLKRAFRLSNQGSGFQGASFNMTVSMTEGTQNRPPKLVAKADQPTLINSEALKEGGPLAKLIPKTDFVPVVAILNQLAVSLGITHSLGLPELDDLGVTPLPPITPNQLHTSWQNNRAQNHIDLKQITAHLSSPATVLIASAPAQNHALKQALCFYYQTNPQSKHAFHVLTYTEDNMHYTPAEFALSRKNPIFKPPHLQTINLLAPNLLTLVQQGHQWTNLTDTPRNIVRFAISHFSARQLRSPTAHLITIQDASLHYSLATKPPVTMRVCLNSKSRLFNYNRNGDNYLRSVLEPFDLFSQGTYDFSVTPGTRSLRMLTCTVPYSEEVIANFYNNAKSTINPPEVINDPDSFIYYHCNYPPTTSHSILEIHCNSTLERVVAAGTTLYARMGPASMQRLAYNILKLTVVDEELSANHLEAHLSHITNINAKLQQPGNQTSTHIFTHVFANSDGQPPRRYQLSRPKNHLPPSFFPTTRTPPKNSLVYDVTNLASSNASATYIIQKIKSQLASFPALSSLDVISSELGTVANSSPPRILAVLTFLTEPPATGEFLVADMAGVPRRIRPLSPAIPYMQPPAHLRPHDRPRTFEKFTFPAKPLTEVAKAFANVAIKEPAPNEPALVMPEAQGFIGPKIPAQPSALSSPTASSSSSSASHEKPPPSSSAAKPPKRAKTPKSVKASNSASTVAKPLFSAAATGRIPKSKTPQQSSQPPSPENSKDPPAATKKRKSRRA